MRRNMFNAKIHRAVITQADLHYEGSLTIDSDLMDAAGYDPIVLETVGVGQDEVDVVRVADAVCVVLVPGMGDDIQAIKSGLMEIADLFCVNKADRPGVEATVLALLELMPKK